MRVLGSDQWFFPVSSITVKSPQHFIENDVNKNNITFEMQRAQNPLIGLNGIYTFKKNSILQLITIFSQHTIDKSV